MAGRSAIPSVLALVLSSAWARTATACAVCLSATDQTRNAYYGTTALLVVLPLLLLGGIGLWLYRAAQRERRRRAIHLEHPAGEGGAARGELPVEP
jgi:hypothetical protein